MPNIIITLIKMYKKNRTYTHTDLAPIRSTKLLFSANLTSIDSIFDLIAIKIKNSFNISVLQIIMLINIAIYNKYIYIF